MDEMPRGGNETILVAEDDEMLRRLAGSVLVEFGYTVILAEDGDDAIEKFKANQNGISLLILDMLMPGKNGKEVYDIIRTIRPEIRALITSGFTSDVIPREGLLASQFDFMMKPVSPMDLLRKIREILDR